jgi:6-methylsalicylate decarboxylase
VIEIDVHQHVWTGPLVEALAARREPPFVRQTNGVPVVHVAGERPYVLDLRAETSAHRAALVELDGLDGACVCLSSALGIEGLAREEALPLLDAYHAGAGALGEPFAVWGAIALDRPDADDVDRALDQDCIGLSLPAGALASVESISRLRPVLARLEARGAALFVHPGPGAGFGAPLAEEAPLSEPLWWAALTRYVAQMHAAWLAFASVGRAQHPRLRVIFAMLAGMAPLHAERLLSRGGPKCRLADPLIFFDTSSYGPSAVRTMAAIVGSDQVLYGSDRPIVEPSRLGMPDALDRAQLGANAQRALRAPNQTRAATTLAR